jgi:hypothetical protein
MKSLFIDKMNKDQLIIGTDQECRNLEININGQIVKLGFREALTFSEEVYRHVHKIREKHLENEPWWRRFGL